MTGTYPTDTVCDAVGIGVGPANLSLAALSLPCSDLTFRFLERHAEFAWHPGLLFPESILQVYFLKDLVTLVDPTNPFSFLSFLRHHRRLYHFIIAGFPRVLRQEYQDYYSWVARSLPTIEFGAEVHGIEFNSDQFDISTDHQVFRSRNIVLGTGLAPYVPLCAERRLCDTVFHAHEFLSRRLDISGKTVALVGGGQTAAELLLQLMGMHTGPPSNILWITRRGNILPIDDSPFTNELFVPSYGNYFFNLSEQRRTRLLGEHRLASDGVNEATLRDVYRRLYVREFVEGKPRLLRIVPSAEVTEIDPAHDSWTISVRDSLEGQAAQFPADVIILCTGYHFSVPNYLRGLKNRLSISEGNFVLNRDLSIGWDGPMDRRIYVQNGARHARGVADSNLSLLAWRSAIILNSLTGREVYDLREAEPFVDWAALNVVAPDVADEPAEALSQRLDGWTVSSRPPDGKRGRGWSD